MGLDTIQQALERRATSDDLGKLKQNFSDFRLEMSQAHTKNVEAISQRAKQEDLERLQQHVSAFEVSCSKEFITQPALMQIMTSLDRTIQQLTQAITFSSQESREGLNALNKRIDEFMQRK